MLGLSPAAGLIEGPLYVRYGAEVGVKTMAKKILPRRRPKRSSDAQAAAVTAEWSNMKVKLDAV